MLDVQRHLVLLCMILLLFGSCPRMNAQDGLNGPACAPCTETGPEAQFRDTVVAMTDVVPGCTVNVEFAMRKCGQNYDLSVKKITLTVTNSGQAFQILNNGLVQDVVTLSIGNLLYRNPMKLPPWGRPVNERYNWRIVRPACWSYNPATKSYAPCAGSSCCFASLAAYYNGCETLTLQSGFQKSQRPPCTTQTNSNPAEGGGRCINTCSDDLLDDYAAAQRRNAYLEGRSR